MSLLLVVQSLHRGGSEAQEGAKILTWLVKKAWSILSAVSFQTVSTHDISIFMKHSTSSYESKSSESLKYKDKSKAIIARENRNLLAELNLGSVKSFCCVDQQLSAPPTVDHYWMMIDQGFT